MTPKEKAEQLVNKFILHTERYIDGWIESDLQAAKVCALIVVDENLEYEKMLVEQIKNHVEIFKEMQFKTESLFWQEVKQELQNLN